MRLKNVYYRFCDLIRMSLNFELTGLIARKEKMLQQRNHLKIRIVLEDHVGATFEGRRAEGRRRGRRDRRRLIVEMLSNDVRCGAVQDTIPVSVDQCGFRFREVTTDQSAKAFLEAECVSRVDTLCHIERYFVSGHAL